ncbi:MAG: NAD(+) synthase [Defluviitaleaceae bacterium]|nr:NAD(+) synthase [Defluviitaleaceae bacterium]
MIKVDKNWDGEIALRVAGIRQALAEAGAGGIVFGSSGGKDSALVGILAKMATDDVLGVMMPCGSINNYNQDMEDAKLLASTYKIPHIVVDLTKTKQTLLDNLGGNAKITQAADININPRLRMTTLYTIAASRNYLVAGTGNRSEIYMGYFTKWGDGAFDLNPIQDLTKTEIFAFLQYLGAPAVFYTKPPSAGLFEGQTDEMDMGITYDELDTFLLTGEKGANYHKIEKAHKATAHKRAGHFTQGDK